ncbi:hypothetical protein V496_10031 [Pseudogymnoascus sp. VKM F-4515 (FW-2607)]|nr:hypothetical protein V496_10031 [Pseudogymnoascus sp. VKM F-4515 (FW-2607)]
MQITYVFQALFAAVALAAPAPQGGDDAPSGIFPSGDVPSGVFPTGGFPTGGFPTGGFPPGTGGPPFPTGGPPTPTGGDGWPAPTGPPSGGDEGDNDWDNDEQSGRSDCVQEQVTLPIIYRTLPHNHVFAGFQCDAGGTSERKDNYLDIVPLWKAAGLADTSSTIKVKEKEVVSLGIHEEVPRGYVLMHDSELEIDVVYHV